MKAQELRELSKEELDLKLSSLEEELFKLQYQRKTGQVQKPHLFKQIKRDIARIKTILRERIG
jgi:large subunit ribosomal protein L29